MVSVFGSPARRGRIFKRMAGGALGLAVALLLSSASDPSTQTAEAQKVCTNVTYEGEEIKQCTHTFDTGYVVERYPIDEIVCDSFLLLPAENLWSPGVRFFLYLFALLYSFLGVAIIADVFMEAIEVITSKESVLERVDPVSGEKETITVKVWHPTIANLSLMALGSSMPEVLLAVIGTIQTLDETPDELGPSTIVGSASFNLMFIIAICVVGIPDGEARKMQDMRVFLTTAASSVLAYVWLAIVLLVWTPDVVTLEEALITFGFFPVLLFTAWRVAKITEAKQGQEDTAVGEGRIARASIAGADGAPRLAAAESGPLATALERRSSVTKLVLAGVEAEANATSPTGGKRNRKRSVAETVADPALFAATVADEAMATKPLSYGDHRRNAGRILGGRKRAIPPRTAELRARLLKTQQELEAAERIDEEKAGHEEAGGGGAAASASDVAISVGDLKAGGDDESSGPPSVSFRTPAHAVMENCGSMHVTVVRQGDRSQPVAFRVWTEDGTATVEDDDYKPIDKVITLAAGEAETKVPIEIVDDDKWEPDETFYVNLEPAREVAPGGTRPHVGTYDRTEVTILNDDNPGMLGFEQDRVPCHEGCGEVELTIVRRHGSDGEVSVRWSTNPDTAVAPQDFEACEGVAVFAPAETSATISVPIVNNHVDTQFEKTFKVVLSDATAGAHLTRQRVAAVTIRQDEVFTNLVDRVAALIKKKDQQYAIGTSSWGEQFHDALSVYQEEDADGIPQPPATADCVMHFLTFFWKVVFATCPPTDIAGGWATFVVAVVFIGVLTAVVGELAGLFGCVVGLKDSVTAITFVALGTSLPDTFASLAAAKMDRTADSAVGNVTGSNSANVFMGLGLPWCIAAIYKQSQGLVYDVPAGDLGFSVVVFAVTAVLALAIMLARELYSEGMLGGPKTGKWVTGAVLVTFWMLYVVLSSLKAYGHLD